MEALNKDNFKEWLVDYITDTIHDMEVENSPEFNKWAKSFERDEAAFVVNMEYIVDFDEDFASISISEAEKYAEGLIQKILDRWYV